MAYKARFTKQLTMSLEPEVYDKIQEISDEENISKSDLVRAIINEGLPKVIAEINKTGFDREGISKKE